MDPNTAMFTPDITPLMLAAHKNNYEIIKILLDRGATLPDPHDIRFDLKFETSKTTLDPKEKGRLANLKYLQKYMN